MRPRRKAVTWRSVGPIIPVVVVATIVAFVWYMIERPTELAEDELRTLLAGNTIEGVWGEVNQPYRQYVDPAGTTLTSVGGGATQAGSWRIGDGDAYCADLVGQGEACYPARVQDDGYLWVDEAKSLGYPFRVLPGQQIEDAAGAS